MARLTVAENEEVREELEVVDLDGPELPGEYEPIDLPDGVELMALDQITGWQGGDPPSNTFLRNVRAVGLKQAVVVRDNDDGTYSVVDGRRRIKALYHFGHTHAPVIFDTGSASAEAGALSANIARDENYTGSAIELRKMVDAGMDREAIMAAVPGLSKELYKELLDATTRLDPRLFRAAEEGKMSKWSVKMAARLSPTAQDNLVSILDEKGKVTKSDVEAQRQVREAQAVDQIPDAVYTVPEADEAADYPEEEDEDFVLSGEVKELDSTPAEKPKKAVVTRQQRWNNTYGLLVRARAEIKAMKKKLTDEEAEVFAAIESAMEGAKALSEEGEGK